MRINTESKWWGAVFVLQLFVILMFAWLFSAEATWRERAIKTHQEPYVVKKVERKDAYYMSEAERWTEILLVAGIALGISAGVFCGFKGMHENPEQREKTRSALRTLKKILRWPKG